MAKLLSGTRIYGSGTVDTQLFVNGTTLASSTNSGALQVAGGVGIGGSLWVGSDTYIKGAIAVTSATVDLYATKTTIFAGTDTAVNTSTGNVTIWNTSTLQSITNRGATTTNAINVANATSATNTATGALTVLGGVGIGGSLFVQGSIFASGGLLGFSQNSISQSTSSVVVTDTGTVQQVTVIIANTTMTTFTQTGVTVVGDVSATSLYDSGRRVVTRVTPTGGTGISVSNVQQNGTATSFTINNTGVLSAAGSAYIGVSPGTGAITITNLGVQTISTGSGISVSTSTGSVTIVSIDNLQLVTDRGAVTTNAVQINNGTNASATNTGALQVLGGLGVGQNLYATQVYDSGSRVITSVTITPNGGLVGGGTITGPSGTITLTNVGVTSINTGSGISVSTSTGSVTIASIDNLQLVTSRGNTTNNTVGIVNGTNASATNTGALQILGGVGVGQSLYATNLYDSGNRVITSVTVNTVGVGLVGAGTVTGPSGTFNLVNTGVTALAGSLNIGVSTSTGSVIVTNLGVTATIGTTYIGVSARTGTVYFTNLGVTDLSGTTYLGVSQSTGSIQLTNLGVQTAIGSTYIGVSQSTGSVTFTNLGVQQILAGTDITVNANTGSVTVNDASTLQSVTGRGATTNNAITISNGTNSTTPVNGGALSVYGGAGVNGNLRVGGVLFVNTISGAVINSATSIAVVNNNTETATLYVTFVNTSTGYAGIQTSAISGLTYVPGNKSLGINTANPAYNLDVNGGTRIAGITTITNTTVATNISSGALQVGGGVGVSGSLYASAIYDNSNRVITSVTVNTAGAGLVGAGTITGPSGSVTLTNVGVTSVTGSQNIGVSTSTGSVVVTNLGVTATVGTTYIGVSAQTGTVHFTNLGVTNLTGSPYLGVSQSTGSITLTNLGVQNITTGSGIGVTTSTGSVIISSIDNLQLVTDRGATTTNAVYIGNQTAGSSTQTGALVVSGGVGIGRNLYVGGSTYLAGDLFVDGTSYTLNSSNIETGNKILYLSTSSPSAITAVSSGIAIGPIAGVYASLLFDGVSSWQSAASIVPTTNTYNLGSYNNPWNNAYSLNAVHTGTTNATSTITGALQVAGGVGIGRDVIIGGNVGIKTNNPAYTLEVAGSFAAQTKSFVIDHPTKPGMRLRYGSLEGPENGVYIRGRLTGNTVIELPDYWTKLVDPNSITVDLTPVGKHQKLYVERIENNTVVVGNGNLFGKDVDCFYIVWAERCDVEKLTVEIFK
jgi:hypothetical protein